MIKEHGRVVHHPGRADGCGGLLGGIVRAACRQTGNHPRTGTVGCVKPMTSWEAPKGLWLVRGWINTIHPAPRALQTAPRAFQTAPRALQKGPRALQTGPRALQTGPRALQTCPRALQTGLRALQIGPRALQTAPRALQTSPRAFQTTSLSPRLGRLFSRRTTQQKHNL